MTSRLSVENLRVSFPTPKGVVEAVRGVSFGVGREKLGIVGESGSGKSTIGRAILRLVPAPGVVRADQMLFDDIDLQRQSEKAMRNIRGSRISMVMQDPKFSLNPVMRVGRQIEEAIRTHEKLAGRLVRTRCLEDAGGGPHSRSRAGLSHLSA